jgi:hypothetical protein
MTGALPACVQGIKQIKYTTSGPYNLYLNILPTLLMNAKYATFIIKGIMRLHRLFGYI